MKTNPFELNEFDTTAAFIDGPALYWAYKSLQRENLIDMVKVRDLISNNSRMQSLSYYTVFQPPSRNDGFDPIKPLAEFLGYNGYRVVTKEARQYQTDLGSRVKGSINLELAIDAFRAAQQGMNHIMLFLSDDDFTPLVTAIQEQGCRVTLVSTETDKIVSDDLVWTSDKFVDIKNIAGLLERIKVS